MENLSEKRLKWLSQTNILMTQGRENKINSSLDEISFWANFVKSLKDLEKKLEKPEIKLTLEILKFAKKQYEIVNKDEFEALLSNAENIYKIM